MASSLTRNALKLSRSVLSVSRKSPQISRYLSSKNNLVASSWKAFNGRLVNRVVPTLINSSVRNSHTDGDKDLIGFLTEEISYEEENARKVPRLKNFNMSMDGSVVTLQRNFKDEVVEVVFDINENVNVDDAEAMETETEGADNEDLPDIVSYPNFTVSIIKPSGNTLVFNCNCNTGINEDEEGDDDGNEQYDLLRFDSVQVFNPEKENKDKVYAAESENMDGELYSLLMNTLLERGVTGTFINELIDLSTAVEHRHYVTFLKSLGNFVKDR